MLPSALEEHPAHSIGATAKILKISQPAVRAMIASGALEVVVKPMQKRPKVLSSSIASAYQRIYKVAEVVEPQAA
jgi:hypothetical protein